MDGHHLEPIDIHQHNTKFARELAALQRDQRILKKNRETIMRFINDARAGRTIQRRAKKRLSLARCRKLIWTLRRFAIELSVPFECIDVREMERFILGTEDGTVRKLTDGDNPRYSPDTVVDFRKIIRKFYRWLLPNDVARVAELTGWFDTSDRPPELRIFSLETVQRLVMSAPGTQGRALIMLLFDGGYRPAELLNIRLGDVSFQNDEDGVRTCFTRVRVSKTMSRTISLPLATEAVQCWLEEHPSAGPIERDGTLRAQDPNATLIAWTYLTCRKLINRLGRLVLDERVYPYRFRHSSATYYARFLTEYQMCARYGWVMGSDSVRRYVSQSGVLAQDTASRIRREVAKDPPIRRRDSIAKLLDDLRSNPALIHALQEVLADGTSRR